MPPLSQYQASRLLELIHCNRATVRLHDHIDVDLWARQTPPLRGLAFESRRHAVVNLVAGSLCAVSTAPPPTTTPTPTPTPTPKPPPPPPPPPSRAAEPSRQSSSTSSVLSRRVVDPHEDVLADLPVPSPLADADRGAITPLLVPLPPVLIPRVDSTHSRASKISSAPSFGKMVDPLSTDSIQADASPTAATISTRTISNRANNQILAAPAVPIASADTTREYEEFGNEALITHVFDDLDDDFDQHDYEQDETPSALFRNIGPSFSTSAIIPRTKSLSSTPSVSSHPNRFQSVSTNQTDPSVILTNYSTAIPLDDDDELDLHRHTIHQPASNSTTLSFSQQEPITNETLSSLQPHHSFPTNPDRGSSKPLNTTSALELPNQHVPIVETARPVSMPPPPPMYSTNSFSDTVSPAMTASKAPVYLKTDSFPNGIPLPPVTPPSAPCDFDEFDSFSIEMEALNLTHSEARARVEETSPVTEATTLTNLYAAHDEALRAAPATAAHGKPPNHANNRSFGSTSDYFSRSEYTGFSDYSRRVDSSVEVETSDEDNAEQRDELDDEELRQAELSNGTFESVAFARNGDNSTGVLPASSYSSMKDS